MKEGCKFFILLFITLNVFSQAVAQTDQKNKEKPQRKLKTYIAEDFFSAPAINTAKLSPDGTMVAYQKSNHIILFNNNTLERLINISEDYEIVRYQWTGNTSITLKLIKKSNGYAYFESFHFKEKNGKYQINKESLIQKNGYIIDPLLDNANFIIFGSYYSDKNKSLTQVYRINTTKKINAQFRNKLRIDKWNRNINYWLTDSQHNLTLGLSYENGLPTIWRKKYNRRGWEIKWQGKNKSSFFPVKISRNLHKLWAITDLNSDRMVAIEFDLKEYKITRQLYAELDTDVRNIQFNANNDPISLSYLEKGKVKYKYFVNKLNIKAQLPVDFKNREIIITDINFKAKTAVISAFSDTEPGSIYYCKGSPYVCSKIQDFYPWLKGYILARTYAHRIKSSSHGKELDIDIFLTIPTTSIITNKQFPLIVMPHGGPIGISDYDYFSGEIQWLAYHGYAVLQVNYRGSGGYGEEFKKAGMKEWGNGIEDDIENALKFALNKYPQLNKERLAVFGGSYGGYSALMSVIRGNINYKCAASFAGVTDLLLMFSKSSIKNSPSLTKAWSDIVGDPVLNRQQLIDYSPVYQYQKINRPILLVHGTKDTTVDIEHSYRLSALLKLAGKEHELYIMDDIGHGFEWVVDKKKFYDKLLSFLGKCL